MAVSPYKEDFEDTLISVAKIMQGLGASSQVHGEGRFNWVFKDNYSVTQEINIKAYYIPTSPVILFSPQRDFMQEKSGRFSLDKDGSGFTFTSGK